MLIPVPTAARSLAFSERVRRRQAVRPDVLVVVLLTALGAALRFLFIAHQSYWADEALTVHEVRSSLTGLLHGIKTIETTPPLYFMLAWLWAKVFGTGEAGLRALSALLGIGLIPLAYACGRELVSRWAGVLVGALVSVSPFMIWYSQEARAYMLFAVFSALSFLFWARLRRGRTRRDLLLWTLFSALAVLTHFFAGFLIAPEALWLLWWMRERAAVVAVAVVGAVQLAVLPLAAGDTNHPLYWIKAFPLAVRIKQVPVDFALSTLFQSQIVTDGLVGAGVLTLVVVGLLAFGGDAARARTALLLAGVAAFVILVPIALAALGRDYVIPRNFTAAWIPLAVILAGACTAPRTLPLGAALMALMLGSFLYAGALIDARPQYQRPAWRAVSAALGRAPVQRAVVAEDGNFASWPLAVYLPRVPWQLNPGRPVSVRELDVVGSSYSAPPRVLPPGVRRLASRTVGAFLVERFVLRPAWRATPQAIGARAQALISPPSATHDVLIQRAP